MRSAAFLRLASLDWIIPQLNLPARWQQKVCRLDGRWQMAIALMMNLLSLAVPILMLQVYDRIIPHQALGTLTMLVAGVAAAVVIEAWLRGARSWLTGWSAASVEHASTCAALEHFCRVDLSAFETDGPGAHMQRLGAASRLREFYSGQALAALVDLPFTIVFLLMIAYLGGWLVLAPLSVLLAFTLIAHHAGDMLKARLEDRNRNDDRKSSYIISVLSGIHTVKALGMELQMLRRFEAYQGKTTQASYRVAEASGLATTLSAAFTQLTQISTAIAGCLMVLHGQLSMGGLSACTLLAGRTLPPIQRVMGTWLRLQDFTVARGHIQSLFAQPEQERAEIELPVPDGMVRLDSVSFNYAHGTPLLEDITLEVEPGEVIAIGGGKGAGKSTLLQLIAGTLTPQRGTVRISGVNPGHYSLSTLSSHIGYLPQQGTIFKGTILQNMTGFQESEEIVAIAKHIGRELGIDKVIDLLPRGYDTMLTGNAADPVPPGIKQRIALVRVLRNLPAILLFDDADRALDKEGYNRLFKMMGRFRGQYTILIVSQDQNLLSFANRSFYLQNGRLTPSHSGTLHHLSLLTPKGKGML